MKKRSCFFEDTFLLADIRIDIVLKILFFTLSNIEIDFVNCYIHSKTFTIAKILLTIKQVKLIRIKVFSAITLDQEHKVFVIHLTSISPDSDVYLYCRVQKVSLKANENSTSISPKYIDFTDVFSKDLATYLPQLTKINNHTIDLIERK